ncbi:MAG: ROK family protein [Aeromicrobium sp.]|uniref:ROK family protein n=1 Tax=Aeromicrobium sp. TaxID=1871063 RepID=UPI0039E30A79
MTSPVPVRVGVDIGGTKIAAAVVEPGGRIRGKARVQTPRADRIAETVAALVREVAGGDPLGGVGIGAAGFICADRSTVLTSANLDWHDAPLGVQVRDLLRVPVVIENDANAAAWAEHRFGAGRGFDHVLTITCGTGIGGGVICGGRLQRGAHGFAAEVGHVRFERGGLPCPCGQRGCWEQYASGSALVRRAVGRVEADSGPQITRLALDGDPAARELLAEVGRDLGEGIASLVAVLDPGVVVIGGGVSEAGDLFLDPVRTALHAFLPGGSETPRPQVRVAELGNDAGIIGAADLAGEGLDG